MYANTDTDAQIHIDTCRRQTRSRLARSRFTLTQWSNVQNAAKSTLSSSSNNSGFNESAWPKAFAKGLASL